MPWAHLRLPPFPQVAVRVLRLANDENVQLHQLCDLISSDPAFASEVLTVANSLLYAPRYPSTSILQAIAVLGANTLQGMCVMVGVRAYLGKAMSFPSMRKLWRHNLACAIIAERMAAAGFIDKDMAYTCGILHDVGRMALAVIQPKAYAALLEKHCGAAATILEAERELFGWDHCETGQQLVSDWKLPDDFEAVVAEHHAARRTRRVGCHGIGESELRDGGRGGLRSFSWVRDDSLSRSAGAASGARTPAVPGRCGNPDARSHRKHPRHRVGVSLRIQLAGLPAKCRYARISLRCNCSSVCPLVSGYAASTTKNCTAVMAAKNTNGVAVLIRFTTTGNI